jgi:hypothetical protein
MKSNCYGWKQNQKIVNSRGLLTEVGLSKYGNIDIDLGSQTFLKKIPRILAVANNC